MLAQRLATWRYVLNTANLPKGMTKPDGISKWLVITRAAVFSMTVTSGLIGGLLAVGTARLTGGVSIDWGLLGLAILGLVVAHAANNMINDFFDLEGGVDTDDYVRALYAPHPILSGWVTKRQLGTAILIANLIDLAILLVPRLGPRAARHRVRARRPVRLGVLRRPADPAQAHRPGRARRVPRLGPAHDRRHVLRRHGHAAGLGLAGLPPLRDPRDDRPVRQAHRQDRGRHGQAHPDAARDPRREGGPLDRHGPDGRVLPHRARRRGARGWIGPWVALVVLGLPRLVQVLRQFAAPRPTRRPSRTSAGPCGTSAARSSTPAARAACSSSACS